MSTFKRVQVYLPNAVHLKLLEHAIARGTNSNLAAKQILLNFFEEEKKQPSQDAVSETLIREQNRISYLERELSGLKEQVAKNTEQLKEQAKSSSLDEIEQTVGERKRIETKISNEHIQETKTEEKEEKDIPFEDAKKILDESVQAHKEMLDRANELLKQVEKEETEEVEQKDSNPVISYLRTRLKNHYVIVNFNGVENPYWGYGKILEASHKRENTLLYEGKKSASNAKRKAIKRNGEGFVTEDAFPFLEASSSTCKQKLIVKWGLQLDSEGDEVITFGGAASN